MKNLFFTGGPIFMGTLTIFLIITTAWIIYHFVRAYNSKYINQELVFRKLGYGKTMGLFTLITGFLGQMMGLAAMFDAIESATVNGQDINAALIFGAIKVTMIVTIYGILIYLFSLLLWFVATTLIEKKLERQKSL